MKNREEYLAMGRTPSNPRDSMYANNDDDRSLSVPPLRAPSPLDFFSNGASHVLESILSQKEQELQHINQLRIKNMEDIIGSKMKMIENMEQM
jgi:hypothetical protein